MVNKMKKQYPVRLQFQLTDKQHQLLEKMAEDQGISMAEVMRNLIAKEVASRTPVINEK